MGHLNNRNIIIGVSGGIAAYKAAELVREVVKRGARVRVVMTQGAQAFITPLTLQALSGNPVHTELLDEQAELGMGHIELARWADAVLIAPATADLMARLAIGRADDLLTTVAVASPAPLFVAPAMNQQMWANSATQANLDQLEARGVQIIGPGAGEQACGDVGLGRLLEPQLIVDALQASFSTLRLAGRKVVITAGPTREALDPVRYLSNHSSGKMGYALARAALDAGATCTLISGPTQLAAPEGCELISVVSACEMHQAAISAASDTDVFIASAAVADYRPAQVATEKIKKTGEATTITLVRNPDIVADVASLPRRPRCVVGFAAETQDVEHYARGKLAAKNLDLIIANDVSRADIGFNSEHNAVTVIDSTHSVKHPIASKQMLARTLMEDIAAWLESHGATQPR